MSAPQCLTIREYACLTTAPVAHPSLDEVQISQSAFDWLCELSARFKSNGATLLYVAGKAKLKWDSYVGVIQTPCGTVLEILPKHLGSAYQHDDAHAARALLKRLIQSSLHVMPRHAGPAALQYFDAPIHEWVMAQFLAECEQLVQRGLRFDYERVESEERFLRGQLDMAKQMRQVPARAHLFHIRYNELSANRPENRLLKAALATILRLTRSAANLQLAHRLHSQLGVIPASWDVAADFARWDNSRLLHHYQPIKPWCELVLGDQSPLALVGAHRSISMLFPMQRLFEAHVTRYLQAQLQPGARLSAQAGSQFLCRHGKQSLFKLQPDVLISQQADVCIVDMKWKLLDVQAKGYNLAMADFYQLYAYGNKYAGSGTTTLLLVYPKWQQFTAPIAEPFVFSEDTDIGKGLRLWVVPFDLDKDALLWDSAKHLLPLAEPA